MSKKIISTKTSETLKHQGAGPEKKIRADLMKTVLDSLYSKSDSDFDDETSFSAIETDFFLDALSLKGSEKILDLCCGSGRYTMELAMRGFKNIEGIDPSRYLINKAKSSAKKLRIIPKFREGDIKNLPYPADVFDVVIITGGTFGHFDSFEDDLKVLSEVSRVLKPLGKLLIEVSDGNIVRETFETKSWEWITPAIFVCREKSLSSDRERLITREIITDTKKGVIADQLYGERLYTKEKLENILEKSLFSAIVFNDQPVEREHELEKNTVNSRMIVTATAAKHWSKKKKKLKTEPTKVGIVLDSFFKKESKADCVEEERRASFAELENTLQNSDEFKFTFIDESENIIKNISLASHSDFVFNLSGNSLCGRFDNDLHIPALLEMFDVLYTGPNPETLACCHDKSMIKSAAKSMGIPVPEGIVINPDDRIFDLKLSFPVIAKPNSSDISYKITKENIALDHEELFNAVMALRGKTGITRPIIVEEFLPGSDISVGLIGNHPDIKILPIIEEDYSMLPDEAGKMCGIEAIDIPQTADWEIMRVVADLDEDTKKFISECSLKMFRRLQCRDFALISWRIDSKGTPKLLHVNPNPDCGKKSHLSRMFELENKTYQEMLYTILNVAERRISYSKKD